ncbi:LysR family transcriptional regulator [Acidicapsa ligni]|uniref:LysR family transcriptional regulator n=1 Tax=Acidicapsa ligni TaxID=542300 RepID=UPI0021DFA780|nr:LysR family transcriptional regulator [Acidicapsa ligni]
MNEQNANARVLSGVSVLAAVVRTGSFVRAAETAGLTQSAVSHSIARLESRLGIRLLHRTTRSVTLTTEGRRFYETVEPLLTGIDDAVSVASGSSVSVRGHLRVSIDPIFSQLLMAPNLGRFLDLYPELSLELITRESAGDLVRDGFDLAVRFGEPQSSSLVARKLLETRIITVAAPEYIAKHGRPLKPKDLSDHDCIQFRDPITSQPFQWEFHRGSKIVHVKTSGRLLLNHVSTMLSACAAGAGIAQVMALGAEDLLRDGLLIDLFPDWPDETFPLYAFYPSRMLPPAKQRAFLDFVLEIAKR